MFIEKIDFVKVNNYFSFTRLGESGCQKNGDLETPLFKHYRGVVFLFLIGEPLIKGIGI